MGRIREELIEQIFGDFKVIRYIGSDKGKNSIYEVECLVCGNKQKKASDYISGGLKGKKPID